MCPLWVRRVDGGEWVYVNSVADAVTHLKTHSTDIFHTQAFQPAKKKARRYFNTKWQIGRPWLQYANGVMPCLACKEYPQPGAQQTWLTGNAQLRVRTVREHSNCGVHGRSLALWESGGASTTVIGGLPEPVRNAIAGPFQLVYRMVKRGSPR